MSDSARELVEQARACLQLVEDDQLSEALVVLQNLSKSLVQQPSDIALGDQTSALAVRQISDLLAQALEGATVYRDSSKTKLQRLRSVQQAKTIYSASALPP